MKLFINLHADFCYSFIQKNSIKNYGNVIFKNYENLILKNKIEKKNLYSNPLFSSITLDDTGENIRKRNLLNPLYTALAKPVQYGPHVKIKGKILNMWGVMYALTTFTVAVVVLPFMIVLSYIRYPSSPSHEFFNPCPFTHIP